LIPASPDRKFCSSKQKFRCAFEEAAFGRGSASAVLWLMTVPHACAFGHRKTSALGRERSSANSVLP
jgi:hypothetical protein